MVIAGLADSSSNAVRLIEQGGVEVNGTVIKDRKHKIIVESDTMIRAGKRKFVRLIRS